jgi:para-aminobenzoate synthetase/4-amino-4-deoxychorismate lyase
MKFISELEKGPREVYCGAIGYITPDMEAIFNVPIRTVILDKANGKAEYGVGGGITWDSSKEEEYAEILTKAKVLQQNRPDFELLESLNLKNGKYFLLEEHLERLQRSANYFNFEIDIQSIFEELQKYASSNLNTEQKVRLLVSQNGKVLIEGADITLLPEPVSVKIADKAISKEELFLYHKTTNRQVYSPIKDRFPEVFDVLLWNEERELTEFTIGNLVVELEGKLFTPGIESGLLPGIFRKYLLDNKIIKERKIILDDLKNCSNAWLINSVRMWVKVEFV